VRTLLVFVVMCLVSAARPAPTTRAHGGDAKLDAAKSHADFVPSRRVGVEPRAARSGIDGVVTSLPSIPPPVRFAFVELDALDGRHTIPVSFARSARGPPMA
jgi:hypothetical protein